MNDIGKELYERVRADFEKRLENAGKPKDMRGVSDYSRLLGRSLAEAIAANVTEGALPDGRLYYNIAESILAPSLRTNYDLVNDTAAEVQRLMDERQGLRIKPARADYPAERVHAVIGAASEEGIPFDKALRRMTSPAENITAGFADDFMKANAEQRSKAGFDTFIERSGGAKCCPWCAGLVGVYAYPKEVPKDVYCRHDNCTCSVTYGTKGGARQNVWTKAKWEVPPVQEPHRMTAEEAAEKGAFDKPKRLTGGANGGIISAGVIEDKFKQYVPNREERKQIISQGISAEKPIFDNGSLAKYYQYVDKEEGYYDVVMHGRDDCVLFYDKIIDYQTLGAIIMGRSDYKRGTPIRLFSCSTGKGDNSFAKHLSKMLQTEVKAPNQDIHIAMPINGHSKYYIESEKHKHDGEWTYFGKEYAK